MKRTTQCIRLLAVVIIACFSVSVSQGPDTGRILYLAFMDTSIANPLPCFEEVELISVDVDANVKVVIPALNLIELIVLNSTNNRQNVTYTTKDLSLPQSSPDANVAIQITSDQKISVHANKAEQGSGDGYMALPLTIQSTEFYIAAYTPYDGKNSILTILAPFDNTCVDVRLVNGTKQSTRLWFKSMKQNEVYNMVSSTQDYTGVFVSATKPICVYGGMADAQVPVNVQSADHLIEQMPPVSEWGTQFIMSSFGGRSLNAGYRFRVVAATDDTVVTYSSVTTDNNGHFYGALTTTTQTLLSGQWLEGVGGLGVNTPTAVMVNCSDPCLVMQYNPSHEMVANEAAPYTDAFMVTVPPLDHYGNNLAFSTSRYYNGGIPAECNDYITIVAHQTDTALLTLNGALVNTLKNAQAPNMWRNLNAPGFAGYSIITMPISQGFYSLNLLSRPNALFACFVYGHGLTDWTAYGYLAGYAVDPAGEAAIVASPLYNMSLTNAVPPTTGTAISGMGYTFPYASQSTVTTNDLAPLIFLWQVSFVTLETTGKLITRVCSEGYAAYFELDRLPAMAANLEVQATSSCPTGVSVDISGYLYYSEYSRGQIKFEVTITGSPSNTFNDLLTCASKLYNYVHDLSNWVNGPDVDGTQFLQRYTTNMSDCDVVHLYPAYMSVYAGGFSCPTNISVSGGADISSPVSTSIFIWSTVVVWILGGLLSR